MDLVDLDLVVAVAEAGSITHGAERVHLSLPSASARIRGLERAIGAALFTRDRRGVTLTPGGMLLLRHARAIRHRMDRMRAELAEHAGCNASVRVLANSAACAAELFPVVSVFLSTRPRIRVDVAQQPSAEIVVAIAERRADLGIVTDSVDLGGLRVCVLRDDPLVVCTGPSDRLAQRGSVRYEDVRARDFVGLSSAATFPLGTPVSYRARLPSIDGVCHAVATGIGVAILPRDSVASWVASERIVTTRIDDSWADRRLVLVFASDDDLTKTARDLRDHLIAQVGDRQAEGAGVPAMSTAAR